MLTKKRDNLLFVIFMLILLLFASIYIFVFRYFEGSRMNAMNSYINMLENEYRITLDAYQDIADMAFSSNINTFEIRQIVASIIKEENPVQQDSYRRDLLNELSDFYSMLHDNNFRQLHFHDSKNRSILRFHRPEKYGDDLTGIRYSVEYVNREHKQVSGFEEGRIFNGYRNVYPLVHEGEHIGSVEISISIRTIIEQLDQNFSQSSQFLLLRDYMEARVFESEQDNYIPWEIDDRFVLDREIAGACIIGRISNKKEREIFRQQPYQSYNRG